jgi:hypothetical protein
VERHLSSDHSEAMKHALEKLLVQLNSVFGTAMGRQQSHGLDDEYLILL